MSLSGFPFYLQDISTGVTDADVLALSPIAMYDATIIGNLFQDEARSTAVAASHDPVASVTDLSGNTRHLQIKTGLTAERPLWNESGIVFDGVNDLLEAAYGSTIAQPFTYVCSFKLAAATSNSIIIGGGGITRVIGENSGNFVAQQSTVQIYGSADTADHVISLEVNGASSTGYIDGSVGFENQNLGSGGISGISAGAIYSSGSAPSDLILRKLVVFNSVLSDENRALVESWADTQGVL